LSQQKNAVTSSPHRQSKFAQTPASGARTRHKLAKNIRSRL
jgi:hypothetical protein